MESQKLTYEALQSQIESNLILLIKSHYSLVERLTALLVSSNCYNEILSVLEHLRFLIQHCNEKLKIVSSFGLSKLPFCNK